jgi:predicted O-methyltransferase YrrM
LYSNLQLAKKFLHYWITASNGKGHGVHSPFVFDFITNVLNDRRRFYSYQMIEALRGKLSNDHRVIEVIDYGAGSAKGNTTQRKVRDIVRNAAKPAKYGRLLFRIAEYYECKQILELGTSLGISTAYLASANHAADVITLEGAPEIAALARRHFEELELNNIKVADGNFDETLDPVLTKSEPLDLVFFDGNHRYEPTLRYFNRCLKSSHENSIFIFDDIHWSEEMEQAWADMKSNPKVMCTIDLFFIGIILFKESFKQKQDFLIRY